MAIAIINSTYDGEDPADVNFDVTHTVSAGSDLALYVLYAYEVTDNTMEIASASWDFGGVGEALTEIANYFTGNDAGVQVWRLANPTPGASKTLRLVLENSGTAGVAVTVLTLSGVDQTTQERGYDGDAGDDVATLQATIAGALSGDMLLSVVGIDNGEELNPTWADSTITMTENHDDYHGEIIWINTAYGTSDGGGEVIEVDLDASENMAMMAVAVRPSAGAITGSVCWGHVTGVTQDNTRTFATNWTGTGTIVGSGDNEVVKLELGSGEYMESEVVNVGAASTTNISLDDYQTGQRTPTIFYKEGDSVVNCEADTWHTYTVPFASDGYVQVRLEET